MVKRRISDREDSVNLGSSDSPTAAVIPFLDPEDEVLAASATAAGAMAVVISPVGVVLHHRDDKAWIPHPGCWSLFGGAVEPGEDPHDTVVRELEEELGLSGVKLRPLWRVVDKGGDGRLLTVFEARTPLGPDQMTLNEGQGLAAFDLDEALHQGLAAFCRRVLTRLAAEKRGSAQTSCGLRMTP
jgi:8-oxo-dGTP diphosphatase